MVLIADSGSTKTDWKLMIAADESREYSTKGLNPYFVNSDDITYELEKELVPFISNNNVKAVFFYGAGCASTEKMNIVEDGLKPVFPNADIYIASDLLGAARALCLWQQGIACILGTGSNSCFYNGKTITENVPSLGYILGDYGSGSNIGKTLVEEVLSGDSPKEIVDAFFEKYKTSKEEILTMIYQKPLPNRYLASFTLFVNEYISHPYLQRLVRKSFDEFFQKNVSRYNTYQNVPVHFTGSVAVAFSDILKESAAAISVNIGSILKSPLESLIQYHANDWIKYTSPNFPSRNH
jgi:glucosamine kinase